jgi:osmotically-inducible protein OsmY
MTTTRHPNDHELKCDIDRELAWASDVNGDRVGIAVNDRAVTLSGQVESYPEKVAAVAAVLRVRGVTAVADEVVVRHAFGPRDDADIAREAANALSNTVVVPEDSVTADVTSHEVTLAGAVAWQHQRLAAEHAIAGIPGVVAVHNLIALLPPEPMVVSADAQANVTAALHRYGELEAQHVGVTVAGTEIRLTGHVGTWTERQQAEFAAWCTPGVTNVDNLIGIAC